MVLDLESPVESIESEENEFVAWAQTLLLFLSGCTGGLTG